MVSRRSMNKSSQKPSLNFLARNPTSKLPATISQGRIRSSKVLTMALSENLDGDSSQNKFVNTQKYL